MKSFKGTAALCGSVVCVEPLHGHFFHLSGWLQASSCNSFPLSTGRGVLKINWRKPKDIWATVIVYRWKYMLLALHMGLLSATKTSNWSLELWLQRETRTKNLVSSPSVYEYTSFSSEVINMIQYHVTDYSERQCTLSCACNSTNVQLWAERENYSSYVFVLDGVWTEGRH